MHIRAKADSGYRFLREMLQGNHEQRRRRSCLFEYDMPASDGKNMKIGKEEDDDGDKVRLGSPLYSDYGNSVGVLFWKELALNIKFNISRSLMIRISRNAAPVHVAQLQSSKNLDIPLYQRLERIIAENPKLYQRLAASRP